MPLPRLTPPALPTWDALDHPARPRAATGTTATARTLARPVALPLAGAVAAGLASFAPAAPAQAAPWPGHPDRSIVVHTVRSGDTATGLAVRYHAWTRELLAVNGLGSRSHLQVGQRLKVPVVVSAARKARKAARPATTQRKSARTGKATLQQRVYRSTTWKRAGMSRAEVRGLIVRTARAHGVPPRLALAVAWQESGWQQKLVSSAGAVGVMQVLPSTGEWMEQYAGRPLQIGDTRDNVLAGVLTLRVLLDNTRIDDRAIAAYYQGLGAVREHGVYRSSRAYIANVRAHQARIARTGSPTA